MKQVLIFKVSIENEDLTTIYFVAKNKQDAFYKYVNWVQMYGANYGVNEMTDFRIEFERTVFE